jgi:hypothetical protein
MNDTFDIEKFSAETRRIFRRQMFFAAGMVVFFFSHLILVVVAANNGFLPLVVDYVEVLGMIAIVGGIALIFYLLSKPPFTTGEWRSFLPWKLNR